MGQTRREFLEDITSAAAGLVLSRVLPEKQEEPQVRLGHGGDWFYQPRYDGSIGLVSRRDWHMFHCMIYGTKNSHNAAVAAELMPTSHTDDYGKTLPPLLSDSRTLVTSTGRKFIPTSAMLNHGRYLHQGDVMVSMPVLEGYMSDPHHPSTMIPFNEQANGIEVLDAAGFVELKNPYLFDKSYISHRLDPQRSRFANGNASFHYQCDTPRIKKLVQQHVDDSGFPASSIDYWRNVSDFADRHNLAVVQKGKDNWQGHGNGMARDAYFTWNGSAVAVMDNWVADTLDFSDGEYRRVN